MWSRRIYFLAAVYVVVTFFGTVHVRCFVPAAPWFGRHRPSSWGLFDTPELPGDASSSVQLDVEKVEKVIAEANASPSYDELDGEEDKVDQVSPPQPIFAEKF